MWVSGWPKKGRYEGICQRFTMPSGIPLSVGLLNRNGSALENNKTFIFIVLIFVGGWNYINGFRMKFTSSWENVNSPVSVFPNANMLILFSTK